MRFIFGVSILAATIAIAAWVVCCSPRNADGHRPADPQGVPSAVVVQYTGGKLLSRENIPPDSDLYDQILVWRSTKSGSGWKRRSYISYAPRLVVYFNGESINFLSDVVVDNSGGRQRIRTLTPEDKALRDSLSTFLNR